MVVRSIAVAILSVASVLTQVPAPQLTPGSVVLLAGKDDAESLSTVKRALLDPDPNVRATAARVAGLSTAPNLTEALIGAVAREQSPPVAAEILRAVLLRAGAAALGIADAQMKRIGAPAVLVTAEWMARVQPDTLITRFPDLVTIAGPSAFRLGPIVAAAAQAHPERANAILAGWMRVAPEGAWSATLRAVIVDTDAAKSVGPVLVDALRSQRATVREETVWTMVRLLSYSVDLPRDAITEAGRSVGQMSAWEEMGRDWVLRSKDSHAGIDRSRTLEAEVQTHWDELHDLTEFSKLRPAERQILREAFQRVPMSRVLVPRRGARTIEPAAPALLASALAASGCQTGDNRAGRADIAFAADGRPSHIDVITSGLTKGCQEAVSALARTSLAAADEPIVPGIVRTVIVPLNDTFTSCVARDDWDTTAADGAPIQPHVGPIPPPQKIRDVQPVYPQDAERARIQGVIIIQAQVSRDGCVRSAAVIRTIPDLDVAALAAVSGWKYTPLLVDGTPKRVEMTVTVNFTLQ